MHIKFLFEIIKLIKTFNLDPLILQDFDQRKIDFLSDQTNICISNFVQINDFLPNYFKAEYTHTKEKYRETIKSLLEEIKNNQGYHVFLKMFNIEAVNKENEKVIPECIEVIEILNESNKIKLPWEVKVHIQYQDEIENVYKSDPLSDNDLKVTDLSDYKYAFVNQSLHEKIMNSFGSPYGNPRRNEIFNLYIQTLLAKKTNSEFKVYAFKNKEGIEVKPDKFLEETENLFFDYYQKIKSELDPTEYLSPKKDTNWNELIEALENLKKEIIKLKQTNLRSLVKFNSEDIDDLVLDIRTFLKANNVDELRWPKVKEFAAFDGSAGLLKRINLAGGMKEVGKLYREMMFPIIEAENKLSPIESFNENEVKTMHTKLIEAQKKLAKAQKKFDKIKEKTKEISVPLLDEFQKNKFWG